MGLDVYYPRVNLSGAKMSPAYEFNREVALPAEENSTKEAPNTSRQRPTAEKLAASVQLLDDSNSKPAAKKTSAPQVAEKKAVTQEQTLVTKSDSNTDEANELRFALRYYKVSDSLAVLDEYPLQQSSDAAQESMSLLKNILRALGLNSEKVQLKQESFNWPLVEGLTSNAGDAVAAKQALQGFIVGRQQQDGFQNLLVFAGLVDDLLVGPDDDSDKDKKEERDKRDYRSKNSDCFISLTHSLQSMLSFPQLKKDVWQQLQALRARLQANQ